VPAITTSIGDIANAAAAAATTAKNATHTAMDAATAAAPAAPGCFAGITDMENAWTQVALAYQAAGQITALETLISTASLTGLVAGVPTGVLDLSAAAANVAAKLASADADKDDAKTYVLTHSPEVLANYADCICSALSLPAILEAQACINSSLPLLDSALLKVVNGGVTAALDNTVLTIVNGASSLALSDCNEGVSQLAQALDLIKTATGVVDTMKECIDKLTSLAPADPLLATVQPKFAAANTALTNAKNTLNNSSAVVTTWQNRARCILRSRAITIRVNDESGDQMGAGVNLSVSNPVIEALGLPGINATGILGSTVCPGSQATITVPLAGIHLDPPPGAPPQPPTVPIVPETGVLVFNVTSPGNQPAFSAPVHADGMTTTGDPLRIVIQLPDTSSITSC
jgi:hypothetical protein